jgi:hypothetical protein
VSAEPGSRDFSAAAIGIASSGRSETIALQECDRRAPGAVPRNHTAQFGPLKARNCPSRSATAPGWYRRSANHRTYPASYADNGPDDTSPPMSTLLAIDQPSAERMSSSRDEPPSYRPDAAAFASDWNSTGTAPQQAGNPLPASRRRARATMSAAWAQRLAASADAVTAPDHLNAAANHSRGGSPLRWSAPACHSSTADHLAICRNF